jgi:hypothetical protein
MLTSQRSRSFLMICIVFIFLSMGWLVKGTFTQTVQAESPRLAQDDAVRPASASLQPVQHPDCEADILNVMSEIEQVCRTLGRNEICYGHPTIDALPINEQISFTFDQPGDSTRVHHIRSLRLSTLDLQNGRWGVAQMRLLVPDETRANDVRLMVFGDVKLENGVEERPTAEIEIVAARSINLRNLPGLSSLVVATLPPGTRVNAVARSEDNEWIQVEALASGQIGWVFSELIELTDDRVSIEDLRIAATEDVFWQPMQVMSFETARYRGCGSAVTDGLLIQTAEGLARVTFMINEISVELLSAQQNGGATAFLQSDPVNGFTLNMLEGSAEVTALNTTVSITQGMKVTVPVTETYQPAGAPQAATAIEGSILTSLGKMAPLEMLFNGEDGSLRAQGRFKPAHVNPPGWNNRGPQRPDVNPSESRRNERSQGNQGGNNRQNNGRKGGDADDDDD